MWRDNRIIFSTEACEEGKATETTFKPQNLELVENITTTGNPFLKTPKLRALERHKMMNDFVIHTVNNIQTHGKRAENRIYKSASVDCYLFVHEQIKRCSLPLLRSLLRKVKSKQAQISVRYTTCSFSPAVNRETA